MAFRHLNRIDRGDYRTRGFTTNAVLTAIILVSLATAVRALLEASNDPARQPARGSRLSRRQLHHAILLGRHNLSVERAQKARQAHSPGLRRSFSRKERAMVAKLKPGKGSSPMRQAKR